MPIWGSDNESGRRTAALWTAGFAVIYAGLALAYRDSYQQDGGYHFLFARWAWRYPDMFVGVWSRPLFTLLYAFPAFIGYGAAKLLSVVLTCATAWWTYLTAKRLGIARATAAIPLLALQPCVALLAFDTMTETLFAFLLAAAMYAHVRGWFVRAILLVSLLPCVRPEGWFLGVFWVALVVLTDRRRWPWTLLLMSGTVLWWLAALIVTGDPLWILHNWPSNWQGDSPYLGLTSRWGRGFAYLMAMPEIAGPLAMWLAVAGVPLGFMRRRGLAPSLFLCFFAAHTALWTSGLFGSAGYPRYFVCVAPAIALVMLEAWAALAGRIGRAAPIVAGLGVALTAFFCVAYVDGHRYTRDFRAVEDAARHAPAVVSRLVWSQAYMCIRLDRDPREREPMVADGAKMRDHLRTMPAGTLVFWDADTGPSWWKVGPADFEALGYRKVFSGAYRLEGFVFRRAFFGYGGSREQAMHLYYKD